MYSGPFESTDESYNLKVKHYQYEDMVIPIIASFVASAIAFLQCDTMSLVYKICSESAHKMTEDCSEDSTG